MRGQLGSLGTFAARDAEPRRGSRQRCVRSRALLPPDQDPLLSPRAVRQAPQADQGEVVSNERLATMLSLVAEQQDAPVPAERSVGCPPGEIRNPHTYLSAKQCGCPPRSKDQELNVYTGHLCLAVTGNLCN